MRVLSLLLLTAVFFGFAFRPDLGASLQAADGLAMDMMQDAKPAPGAKPKSETQPTTKPSGKPEKTPKLDDEIKALALKPQNLGSAMHAFESEKLDQKLRGWAKDGATEFDAAKKTGVKLAALAKAIDWKKSKKRNKDPKGFDEAVTGFETATRKFAEAALKKDNAELKSSAEAVSQSCGDCHSKVK